jgi:adenylate cyclase class 2
MENIELEAKFWLPHFLELRKRIIALGATLISPRVLEYNLRLDTPERALLERGEVLRLRQAEKSTLTYKQPGERHETRAEWEIEIDDFKHAQSLLEALGYEVIHRYEKYREVFKLDPCLIMLDEVPYGCFVEIEGPDLDAIQSVSDHLQLHWDRRVQRTYLDMFQALRHHMKNKPEHATFEAFSNQPHVTASLLNLPRADQGENEEVEDS